MHHSINFTSKHFVIHPLAEGVFAAIAVNGGSAICNAGLINLGGQILVFDTFLTPQAAMDLQQAAIVMFGRTPQIVINSHYHNDHTWGNQVFASSAPIISSVRTRQLMMTEGVEEFQSFSMNAAKRLESLQNQYENAVDEQQRQELLLWMGEYGGVVEALPDLKIRLPGITFDHRLEIHGEKQAAQLITFEGAHSGSDTVLYLPQAGTIFMSDLLFVGFHPYLADGDPLQLLQALSELSQLNATCFVPGHGPIGTAQDVALLIAYIEHCCETARKLVETGEVNEVRIKELKVPEQFQYWHLLQFYQANIRFICGRLRPAKGNQ
jgi:glyoxylase-like metal-dependent hydrolase (beta-lactamase superfamily II)